MDVQRENKTLATITFQNYFRLYGKLSGMTGTALTEEEEFTAIYELDIIEILKEIIEGTQIAHEFRKIYACSFLYDVDGI